MNDNEIKVLQLIKAKMPENNRWHVSLTGLQKLTAIPEKELDNILEKLEKGRMINEFSIGPKSEDIFIISLTKKGIEF